MTTWKTEGIKGLYKGATPPLIGWSVIDTTMIGTYHTMRRLFMQQHARKQHAQAQPGKVEPLAMWEVFVCGTVGGWASSIIATPFEQVKARLQVQYADSASKKYKGPIDCMRSLVRNNGLQGMYWGFWATFSFRSFMGYYFMSYEYSKSIVEKAQLPLALQSIICGGAAATALWLVAFPTDVVKNRMMAQEDTKDRSARKYRTVRECWRKIYKAEGIKGFYRGFTPCLLRSIPANGSAFLAMEMVLHHLP